jgi:hypothetical protein
MIDVNRGALTWPPSAAVSCSALGPPDRPRAPAGVSRGRRRRGRRPNRAAPQDALPAGRLPVRSACAR